MRLTTDGPAGQPMQMTLILLHNATHASQAAVPVADGGDVGAAGYEAALDGLEALRTVLRDEHSLLTQYKMIVWGRIFTPVQVRVSHCLHWRDPAMTHYEAWRPTYSSVACLSAAYWQEGARCSA